MKKYIIRNCPAWQPHEVHYCYNSGNTRICPVYKDCILKQIVDECKKVIKCDSCELNGKQECVFTNCANSYALDCFANNLLQLLDIQEVK